MRKLTVLAVALAQLFVLETRGDPTIGGTTVGNALNPGGVNPQTSGAWMDPDGMGTRAPAARSPAGPPYLIPLDPGDTDLKKGAGWINQGFVELGLTHTYGADTNAGFRNYKDIPSGAYVDSFGFMGNKPDEARYYEATGGALGMDDQFYRVQFGRYNDWKVTAFYDSVPRVYTSNYRSLWFGTGTNTLTLSTLTPGGTTSAAATQANILDALSKTPDSDLETIRKTAGVRVDKKLTDTWSLYASVTDQAKKGTQPFGAVFGGAGGGGDIDVPQSIDYSTYDFLAGASFADALSSFNVKMTASFFRNNIDTMTFQNPLYVTLNGTSGLSPASFTTGRFDLAPNNEAYNLRGEYARSFPDFYRGKLTATVAIGTMRQNDALIPPSEFPLTGGLVTPGNVPLANQWNTTSALSRQSAEARIDTLLADLGLVVKPAKDLDVRGKVRFYETKNDLSYQSCNPLTGQWGRILNDGSGTSLVMASTLAGANPSGTSANAFNAAGCNLAAVLAMNLAPSVGNVPIASVPYDYRQLTSTLSADYRVGRAQTLTGTLERESYWRDDRERDQTWDDKVKLAFVDRGTLDGSIRIGYEYDNRSGSAYTSNPYSSFYSMSFGPVPAVATQNMASWIHAADQFRSADIADRTQNIANARVDYSFSENLDGAMSLQHKDTFYPSQLGLSGRQKNDAINFDLNYQAGPNAVVFGYYSYSQGNIDQKGVQPNSCTVGSTYYFFSNGAVASAVTGAAPPAAPAGTTLVGTQNVATGNWNSVCTGMSAASPMFPDSRGWDVASKDRNNVFGAGVKYDFGKVKLDTDFTRVLGRTSIDYSYNAAALGLTALQAGLAGSGLPDLTFAQSIFNANLLVPLNKTLLMRFMVRYESGKVRDWHYEGVAANPMPANNTAFLDAGPTDYRVTTVGVLFQLRM
ncbi:MAG TPA: MtrB/PioB family outer membrane beta-barrel protein [Usitatibacter sp.]|nr:MtrB/PioB family outer membrane beta-barrel protein [Usitatibacter sp.]